MNVLVFVLQVSEARHGKKSEKQDADQKEDPESRVQ